MKAEAWSKIKHHGKIAFSVCLCVDAAHSVFYTYRLYLERIKVPWVCSIGGTIFVAQCTLSTCASQQHRASSNTHTNKQELQQEEYANTTFRVESMLHNVCMHCAQGDDHDFWPQRFTLSVRCILTYVHIHDAPYMLHYTKHASMCTNTIPIHANVNPIIIPTAP